MLAIETILGALTGYFTNDIAIRQLFSKNGVVVRERAQFTEMIVQVLQEQIIDEETVQSLCDNPEMTMMFERFLRELLTEVLPYALSDCALVDLDEEGALRRVVVDHIAALPLADVALDGAALQARLSALFDEAAFQQQAQSALSNVAALSLRDLGAAPLLAGWVAELRGMDEAAYGAWLARWQAHLTEALAQSWTMLAAEGARLGDLLPLDGEALAAMLEDLLLAHQPSRQAPWLDVLKNLGFQEQLYLLAERLLQALVAQHLPSLIEAFYPLLAEDQELLEQMLVQSVEDCETIGPLFRDGVAGYLRSYFADNPAWLADAAAALTTDAEAAARQQQIADYLLSWVVREIDGWRQAAIDSEETMAQLRERLQLWRPLLVQALARLLALPLEEKWLRGGAEKLAGLLFARIGTGWTAAELADRLEAAAGDWLDAPLSAQLLTPQRQTAVLATLRRLIEEQGQAWLDRAQVSGETLQGALIALFDWLYTQPLARLICRSREALPLDQMATAVREKTFAEMRPFLGAMTQKQLDALSHEEIRQLVLDMLGREMRPLAYLGGGIGAIAGAATGVAMDMSGMTPDPDQVAALMAVRTGMYGVVGYGTNVMAVKGLFWPYQKTLGVQGLISRNQTRFAEKMKEMAEAYIINDAIWAEQVARVAEHVDARFAELAGRGLEAIAQPKDAWQLPLKQWLTSHAGAALGREGWRVFMGRPLSPQERGAALGALASALQCYQRGIDHLAMKEAAEGRLAAALVQTLQDITPAAWQKGGNALLQGIALPAQRASYARLWQRCLPYYQGLPTLLLKNSDGLVAMMGQALRKKLPFALQLGYRMAGGDAILAEVLAVFLANQLPGYLQKKEVVIGEAAVDWLEDRFAGHSLVALGITLSDTEGRWLAQLAAALSAEKVQLQLLQLLKQLRALPEAQAAQVTRFAATVAVQLSGPVSGEVRGLHWQKVQDRLDPALVAVGEGVLQAISFDALLSLPQGTLWRRLSQVTALDEEETAAVVDVAQRLYQLAAPAFWGELAQEGRALLLLVDVPGLVEERICALSPELLEALVRGIAQPYFTRVERMGWLGAVVAVPATMLSRMFGGF